MFSYGCFNFCSSSGAQNSPTQAVATAMLAEISPGQGCGHMQLTIAHGAPLIDVLREACSQLGTELDAPSSANEPGSRLVFDRAPHERCLNC